MNRTRDDLRDDIRPIVRRLGKPPGEWQREDLVRLCLEDEIRIINLHYPGLDGKLRELRMPVNDRKYLERVLATGERVDGSSLFPGLFDPGRSDLYVVPVYQWAFLNPWADDEVDIVCRFVDRDGSPCAMTPDNILKGASDRLSKNTGADLKALAELEFYLILDRDDERFSGKYQRNYHQGAPYLHGRAVADDILRATTSVTGPVKYCHSEVGYIDLLGSDMPELHGRRVEQYELEFDLMPIDDLGCWLTVAKWLIRVIANMHGASVTYVPKLDEGMAGSGLHIHLALEREGRNVMCDDDGELTDDALRLLGGLLRRSDPLTGFGSTVAASYLRLVPGQEAPTSICWGRYNRSSLIRVPLSFATAKRLDLVMNPREEGPYPDSPSRPTVEYRSPDGSAFVHLMLAAITICVEEGLASAESAELARRLEVPGDAPSREELLSSFAKLPETAMAAARSLQASRGFFEDSGFPPRLVDVVISKLEAEADEGLRAKLRALPATERLTQSRRLMHKDLHKH